MTPPAQRGLRAIAFAWASLAWGTAVPASAHPRIDDARRACEEARFEDAIRILDRSEREETLDRVELVELYELRSLARYAAADPGGMEADLLAWASLDPARILPEDAPSAYRLAFERARARVGTERLGIALSVEVIDGDAHVRAAPQNDVAALARAIVLHVERSSGPERIEDAEAIVRFGGDRELTVRAVLVGPAGAVIATSRAHRVTSGEEHEPSVFEEPWLWVAAGSSLAIGAAVVLAIALWPDADTALGRPSLRATP